MSADRRIVYVLGPGRSGTSTMAGALVMSGLDVPGRAIGGNETNPSGFYEPRWVVDLHKRLLERTEVATLDADPRAYARVQAGLGPRPREVLRTWLAERLLEQPRLVVKDPRGVWFKDLWSDVAADLDVPISFLTMLRHPAEVSGSRQRYYSKSSSRERSTDDVTRIGGWLNVALTAERVTRGAPRVFVRYADLLEDWRPALSRVAEDLDLVLDPGPEVHPHAVDSFIDPALHRVRIDWDDVPLPEQLRQVGDRAWHAFSRLAEAREDAGALAEVDAVREAYETLSEQALALHRQTLRRLEAEARRKGRVQGRKEAEAASRAVPGPDAEPDTGPRPAPAGRTEPGLRGRVWGSLRRRMPRRLPRRPE